MKKFIYLFLMLIPAFALVSCSDDDDLPNVDFNITFENAVEHDGALYVVQGETFEITGITVVNKEEGKGALITSASYYWNGYFQGTNPVSPFAFALDTAEGVPVGKHALDISCPLYAVDKSPAVAVVYFPVYVVASADEIPDEATPSTRISPKISNSPDK